ncbi:Xaa-Pro peptidase family protein [Arhodomonas aquaeolei]|uniref:M24 family metallopeptidase n=1 Tax=Arhodomonas aquaeolei TaxID=2369 RepID=UPI002166EF76|nr:Xaa-Pro peptidase family protein [Arhodomonas aquaeolei]MCS4502657.1 Xaa-Pro peptidase family protein [Arhodomonas aquaeolei]
MDYQRYREVLSERVGRLPARFDAGEYRRRLEAVRAGMQRDGLEALLVTDAAEVCYLTGYSTFEVSVSIALVVTPSRTWLQVPSIETGPAVTMAHVDEIVGYRWEFPHEATQQLAEALAGARRVGVDEWAPGLRPGLLAALREVHRAEWVATGELVAAVRRVKSDAELAVLAESARITEAGLAASAETVAPGVTDSEVAAAGARAMLAAGSEFMSMQPIVAAGVRSSIIHSNHNGHRIADGEPVFLEYGAVRGRYTAPQMRTVVCGEPTQAMRGLYGACAELVAGLREAMRPGNTFDAAARAAEAVLAPHADSVFFSGVFGYTVGVQFPPSWVEGTGFIARGVGTVFEPGMVFHLPICLRRPGEWGIGMSETVVVEAGGARAITANDWELGT